MTERVNRLEQRADELVASDEEEDTPSHIS
jgi:hypothetical protein